MTFEAWMVQVDNVFVAETSLGRDDWPDNCYWDMWESGMTPREAFLDTMESEGMDLSQFGEE